MTHPAKEVNGCRFPLSKIMHCLAQATWNKSEISRRHLHQEAIRTDCGGMGVQRDRLRAAIGALDLLTRERPALAGSKCGVIAPT
jgi:hypothetical protein